MKRQKNRLKREIKRVNGAAGAGCGMAKTLGPRRRAGP